MYSQDLKRQNGTRSSKEANRNEKFKSEEMKRMIIQPSCGGGIIILFDFLCVSYTRYHKLSKKFSLFGILIYGMIERNEKNGKTKG